jgi:adenylate kinase family enzyme
MSDVLDTSSVPTKITIFGTPGSGKTRLAHYLGKQYNLPVHHLDNLLWGKGWILRDKDDFLKDQNSIINTKEWIIEGSAISTLEQRYQHSDLVIFLHPARLICLYRVIKRLLVQKTAPLDKPEGNRERVSWDFIKYLWSFEYKALKKIHVLESLYPHIRCVEITDWQWAKIISRFL